MNDEKNNTNSENLQNLQNANGLNGKKSGIYGIIAAVACGLGAVLYALAFSPVAIYGLIGGIVSEIAALGLVRAQKKIAANKVCKVVTIAAYILLACGVLFLIGGIIWASSQK